MRTPTDLVCAAIYFVLMPAAFLACIRWLFREIRRDQQLRDHGVLTYAKVVGLRVPIMNRGGSYFVTYRFEADTGSDNRETFTVNQEISSRHFKRLSKGMPVTVSFMPDAPNVSRLSGSDIDHTSRLRATYYVLLLGAVWLALLITILRK